jgi:hypothetical protein
MLRRVQSPLKKALTYMAFKLASFSFTPSSRRLASEPVSDVLDYKNKEGQVTLSVPVYIAELENGLKGMVSHDNFPTFHKALYADSDGFACLPDGWKVGAIKNGNPLGFWYDSETLGGSPTGTLQSLK